MVKGMLVVLYNDEMCQPAVLKCDDAKMKSQIENGIFEFSMATG